MGTMKKAQILCTKPQEDIMWKTNEFTVQKPDQLIVVL